MTDQQTPEQTPQNDTQSGHDLDQAQTDQAAEIARLQAENARLRVAAETGVPVALLTATDETQLQDQAAAIKDYAATIDRTPAAPPPTPLTPDTASADPLGDLLRR